MDPRAVFVIGATGYIGGSIFVGYLHRYPEYNYTVLVRNPKDNAAVEALGPNVKVITGSSKDEGFIEKIASQHDIVANFADADDLPLATAIVKGLLSRGKAGAARKPILIHTSGTGVLSEGSDGAFHPGLSEKIYDDNNVDDIKGLGPKQPHRDVDLTIFAAGETGLIDTYIVAPSTIYGTGKGPVRRMSVQVNSMIRLAVQKKQLYQVGPATNVWNSVHIDDLMELYGLVLDLAISENNTNTPYENFFFGSSGSYVWADVAKELARLLHGGGLIGTDVPKGVAASQAPDLTTSNSRSVANRGLALGWKPSGKSLMETLPEEIDLTLSQMA